MQRIASIAIPLLLAACGANEGAASGGGQSAPGAGGGPAFPADPYEGPEIEAALEVMESQPPQYALVVRAVCPSGGHELVADGVRRAGSVAQALVTLTRPGPDEMVTMAFETKSVRIPLDPAPARIEVRVATARRNVHTLVPPPYLLARVVERKD